MGHEAERKRVLKEVIKQLHDGLPPQEVKERFKQVLEGISPLEIAKVEQELIEEGMQREEVHRLCDIHLEVFKERLEKQRFEVSTHSPINVLMEEHKILLQLLEKLKCIVNDIQREVDVDHDLKELENTLKILSDAERHYLREENVLFSILEKHGITEPPVIMWMEHDRIREMKKKLKSLVENYNDGSFKDFQKQLGESAQSLVNLLSSHISKENNVLFPIALQVMTQQELDEAINEFDEIGYCNFTPKYLIQSQKGEIPEEKMSVEHVNEGLLQLETGTLSKVELEAILNRIPIDITFVDEKDTVRYFNKSEGRIFTRTKSIIGRRVQQCHPQKSVHIVNRILDSFRSGKKDVAEFWIQMGGRMVHIRYFAVRNKDGKYLGTIEVTQDITDIKKIEDERRLLDWEG